MIEKLNNEESFLYLDSPNMVQYWFLNFPRPLTREEKELIIEKENYQRKIPLDGKIFSNHFAEVNLPVTWEDHMIYFDQESSQGSE